MQSGKVKHYNNDKGFGFIDVDNENEDAFFHISHWQLSQPPTVGQPVYLATEYNDKKQLRAIKVSANPISVTPQTVSKQASSKQPSPKQSLSKRQSPNQCSNDNRTNQSSHTAHAYRRQNKKGGLSNIVTALVIVAALVFGGSKFLNGELNGTIGNLVNPLLSGLFSKQSNHSITSSSTDYSGQSSFTGDAQIDRTVHLIKTGGPFPYPSKDGTPFYNREGRLPVKPRGYYHEYTVPTPGVSHRGARRIVTGGNPPTIYYLTVDHYGSFTKLEVN